MSAKKPSWITRLMQHPLYPAIFQWTVLALLLFTAYAALFTTFDPERNFALVFIWIFWGTVAPISVLLFGRFWCAMCPFYLLSGFLSRQFGRNKPLPMWIRKYGFWVALGLFMVIIWFEHAVNIFQSPILTLLLLVPVLIGVVAGALLYRNEEFWCHKLCPFGPLARNYSLLSLVEVRAKQESCNGCKVKSCYLGNHAISGCPVGLYARSLDSMQDCIACGECFKACPTPGTLEARFRNLFDELKRINLPKIEAATFASIWPGVLAVHFFTLLPAGDQMMKNWMAALGTSSYVLVWTLLFAGAILASLLTVAGSTLLSAWIAGERFKQRFVRFAYAVIPLAAAIHTAFNMPRFFGEKGLNRAAHNLLAIFGYSLDGTVMVLGQDTIRVLMFGLLGAGLIGSLVVLGYISNNAGSRRGFASAVPVVVMVSAFTLATGALFRSFY